MDDVLATVEVRRRRFTVEEYYRMAEIGILTERDRVELIDGEIVEMTPIGHHHAACVHAVSALLTRALGDRALVWPQNPVLMPRNTEPQPDVVLLRPPLSQYWARLPLPADVLLLVEVADTSYRFDREIKLPLYAAAGTASGLEAPSGAVTIASRATRPTRAAPLRRHAIATHRPAVPSLRARRGRARPPTRGSSPRPRTGAP